MKTVKWMFLKDYINLKMMNITMEKSIEIIE